MSLSSNIEHTTQLSVDLRTISIKKGLKLRLSKSAKGQVARVNQPKYGTIERNSVYVRDSLRIRSFDKLLALKAVDLLFPGLRKLSYSLNLKSQSHKITVLKSPHVNKKSREQFSFKEYHYSFTSKPGQRLGLTSFLSQRLGGVSVRLDKEVYAVA